MPPRACLACGLPLPGRTSRHSACGGRPTTAPPSHDARQKTFRRAVLKDFQPGDPCGKCGLPIWTRPDAGHIIPRSMGGTYSPTNGRPEHPSCNRAEGKRIALAKRSMGRAVFSRAD